MLQASYIFHTKIVCYPMVPLKIGYAKFSHIHEQCRFQGVVIFDRGKNSYIHTTSVYVYAFDSVGRVFY